MFTGNDLRRVKEDIANGRGIPNYSGVALVDIIARLEASERLLDLWLELDDECEIDGSVFDKAMDDWKKSKGLPDGEGNDGR